MIDKDNNNNILENLRKRKIQNGTLIKICGMTTPEDIAYANEYRPDLIGCVLFFPKSKRNISLERAEELLSLLSEDIPAVAVTVSPTAEQLKQIESVGFDFIQIHGIISEEVYEKAGVPILRAFNVTDLAEYEKLRNLEKIAGYVFDSKNPGSGQTFDWNLIKQTRRDEKLWLLAGGINVANVKEAVRQTSPDGIDVSSAVERPDVDGACAGKDPEKMKEIIRMVHNEE